MKDYKNETIIVKSLRCFFALGIQLIIVCLLFLLIAGADMPLIANIVMLAFILMGIFFLVYYKRMRIIFAPSCLRTRKWGWIGQEREYAYSEVTCVKAKLSAYGATIKIYSQKKNIAQFMGGNQNSLEAIAKIIALNLPMDMDSAKKLSSIPLWLPLPSDTVHDFCSDACHDLNTQILKWQSDVTAMLGADVHVCTGVMVEDKKSLLYYFSIFLIKKGTYALYSGKSSSCNWAVLLVNLVEQKKTSRKTYRRIAPSR